MSAPIILLTAWVSVFCLVAAIGLGLGTKPPGQQALERFEASVHRRAVAGARPKYSNVGGLVNRVLRLGRGWVTHAPVLSALWMRRRARRFVAQMPEALELIGRVIRAGLGIAAGFQVVSEEMTGPAAGEFGRLNKEHANGIRLDDSLGGLTRRVPAPEVQFFVAALLIHETAGGALPEVLDSLALTIRQRLEARSLIRAKSAEARATAYAMIAIGPLVLAGLGWLDPSYVAPMFLEEQGRAWLTYAATLQVLGLLVMSRMIRVRV